MQQQEIIKHYGYENQLLKLVEEMRELEAVIINDPDNIEHIQEEMADVINLLEQIIIHKSWYDAIQVWKQYKINRQIRRIHEEWKSKQ